MSTEAKIRPAQDYCLIRKDPEEKVSEGGIIMVAPKDRYSRLQLRWGTVVAAGPGKWSSEGKRLPMSVKPGDHVGFAPVFSGIEQHGKFQGTHLQGEELLLRNSDIWAIEERD